MSLYTYETVHRQQTTLKPCLSIWQLIALAWMWLRGEEPKTRGMRRGSRKPVWVKVVSLEAALDISLKKGLNFVQVFDGQWCVAV